MYGIYAYIGVVWGVNVGIYGIHGAIGHGRFQSPLWAPRMALENRVPALPSADGRRVHGARRMRHGLKTKDLFGDHHDHRML